MSAGEGSIAVLTDFGVRDPYVGIMHGVILGIFPRARIVDLCHEIPPGDLLAAAFVLRGSRPYFERGSLFLVVVDPGVGTARRMVCARAAGQTFVGPDNGVLEGALRELEGVRWWEIHARRWFPEREPSSTFHGRDYFAPSAAFLAGGGAIEEIAAEIAAPRRLSWCEPYPDSGGGVVGRVVLVDRFGNLISDLPAALLGEPFEERSVMVGETVVERFARVFADVEAGGVFAYAGSFGTLEIGCNQGSAAAVLGAGAGARVRLERR